MFQSVTDTMKSVCEILTGRNITNKPTCLTNVFQSITDAMKTVCEILTADPDGGPARIPFQLFQDLYRYLAQIDGDISTEHINQVISHLQYDVYVLSF